MDQEQRIAFVRSHRTAVFGFNRKSDGPGMSVVYYVMDGNDILISTMEGRGKAKAVRRNPKVSLCVLDEHGHSPIPRCMVMRRLMRRSIPISKRS